MTMQSIADNVLGEAFSTVDEGEVAEGSLTSYIEPGSSYPLAREAQERWGPAGATGELWMEQQVARPAPTVDTSFSPDAVAVLPSVMQAKPIVQLTSSVPTEKVLAFIRGARSNLGTEPGWGERLMVDLVDLPKVAPTTTVHVFVVKTVPFEIYEEAKRVALHAFALKVNPIRPPRYDVLSIGRYQANRVIEELFSWPAASIASAAGLPTTPTVDEAANYKIVIHSVLPPRLGRVVEPRDQRSLRGFAFDKATLTAEHERTVEWLAWDVLHSWHSRTQVVRIEIDGHTDPVGTAAYNRDLGLRRATAVADRLKQLINEGAGRLPAGTVERIEYVVRTYGEERPISSRVQALNRRVEITLHRDTSPAPTPLDLNVTVSRLEGLLVTSTLPAETVTRLRCLLQKVRDPDSDDRFVTETQVFMVNRDNKMPTPTEWTRVRTLVLRPDLFAPDRSDAEVLVNLGRVDEDLQFGVQKMNQIIEYASGIDYGLGFVALANAFKELNTWVLERLADPKSVYSCYPDLRP